MSSTREALELFNEKVLKLGSLPFMEKIRSGTAGVRLGVASDGTIFHSQREGMSDESIEACVLTLRFFIQDNERTSIRNVSALYANDVPALAADWDALRSGINVYLDAAANVIHEGVALSRRDIFETFIYGHLSHSTAAKRAKFLAWKANVAFAFLENSFMASVGHFVETLIQMKTLNDRALACLA